MYQFQNTTQERSLVAKTNKHFNATLARAAAENLHGNNGGQARFGGGSLRNTIIANQYLATSGASSSFQTPVQMKSGLMTQAPADLSHVIHQAALAGVQSSGTKLPHLNKIKQSFGADYDVDSIRAHTGQKAQAAASSINAFAYARGNDIAFASRNPDVHTVAHEAAHVMQQREGLQLQDSLGHVNDRHEQQADTIARYVVQGKSAAHLLPRRAGTVDAQTPATGFHRAENTPNIQRRLKGGLIGGALGLGALGLLLGLGVLTGGIGIAALIGAGLVGAAAGGYLSGPRRPVPTRYINGHAADLQNETNTFNNDRARDPNNNYTYRADQRPGFDNVVQSGEIFFWTYDVNGVLAVGNGANLKHAVLAGGEDVFAAGKGKAETPDPAGLDQTIAALDQYIQNARNAMQGDREEDIKNSLASLYEQKAGFEQQRNQAQRQRRNNKVLLDFSSGHYTPRVNDRYAWQKTQEGWRNAGYTAKAAKVENHKPMPSRLDYFR